MELCAEALTSSSHQARAGPEGEGARCTPGCWAAGSTACPDWMAGEESCKGKPCQGGPAGQSQGCASCCAAAAVIRRHETTEKQG